MVLDEALPPRMAGAPAVETVFADVNVLDDVAVLEEV